MKLSRGAIIFYTIIVTSALGAACLHAQTNNESDVTVLERGANHKIVQRVTWQTNAFGEVSTRTNKYTELATGLNYQENGEWKESKAEIEILDNGNGAIATQGGHKVSFTPNLDANGGVDMQMPDGRHLRSQILGLGYYDRVSGESEIIAVVKDVDGELHGSNVVVYPDAFTGVDADVRFTYRISGFEQDVILRSQPPPPQKFGLNPTNTHLEVFTEFVNPPTPVKTVSAIPGTTLTDEKLNFGRMVMGRGRAFPLVNGQVRKQGVATGKLWITVDGRTVLVEGVEYMAVEKDLKALPEMPKTSSLLPKIKNSMLAVGRKIPGRSIAKYTTKQKPMMLASAPQKKDGFVLDYIAMNSSVGNFTFAAGETYFIDDYLTLYGTTTFQGGAIIKFAAYGAIEVVGPVVCNTSVGNGVMFTSMNDDTWGDIISGSTGSPQNGDVHADMLTMNNGDFMPVILKNLMFRWGSCGIKSYGGSEIHAWHCTFDQMHYQGISADILKLRNCWFNQVGNPDGDYAIEPYYSLDAQHVTVNKCLNIWGQMPETVALTNCLFTSSGNLNYAQNISQQAVEVVPNPTSCPYYDWQWWLMLNNPDYWGYYSAYLVTNSPYRNLGTTNMDATLLGDIKKMTTYWPGQAPAYAPVDTGLPDLGFHYPSGVSAANALDTDGDGMVDVYEDVNQNGVYDAGDRSDWQSADTDGDGTDDLTEILAGTDPNTINFTPIFAESHVRSNLVTGIVEVINGVPFNKAVLVNSTNFENATWTSYTSNLTVNLGTTDGVYEVRVGLKGNSTGAEQVWELSTIIRDTTPPVVVITNPVPGTISAPMIQLRGYSPECLSTIRYDITNSLGLVTNMTGHVTGKQYDTNTMGFTTNWFECLDIDLAVGLNTITLRIADLSGNVTTTNLNYTVNYSTDTVAPSLDVHWPQDGALVTDDTLVVRGFVNEPTSKVMVKIIRTGISTNINEALVERDGLYWAETVPVGSGTNYLTLTATDAAGNITTTNLSIVKSSLQLIISPLPYIDMNTTQISVSGTIDASDYTVWVNGVKATMSGNNWSATSVPVPEGGTAVVQARAIPNTDNGGNGSGGGSTSLNNSGNPSSTSSVNQQSAKDKDVAIRQTVFNRTVKITSSDGPTWSKSDTYVPWVRNKETRGYFIHQTQTATGSSSARTDMTWPPCSGCSSPGCAEEPPCVEGTWTATSTVNGVTTTSSGNSLQPPELGGWNGSVEYVRISNSAQYPGQKVKLTINDNAASQFELFTGGKAGSKRKHLFVATASAKDYTKWYEKGTADGIPSTEITVGEFGKLKADGTARKAFEDNTTHDVTVTTPRKYYSYNVTVSKQCLPKFITFDDIPRAHSKPWYGRYTLRAVCDDTNTVLASFTYWVNVDANTNITTSLNTNSSSSCGKIVVNKFSPWYASDHREGLFSNEDRNGLEVKAYFIDTTCCNGLLRWWQTEDATTNNPAGFVSNTPSNDCIAPNIEPVFYYPENHYIPDASMVNRRYDYEGPCP